MVGAILNYTQECIFEGVALTGVSAFLEAQSFSCRVDSNSAILAKVVSWVLFTQPTSYFINLAWFWSTEGACLTASVWELWLKVFIV